MVLTRVRIPRRALGREVHILLLAAHPVTRPSWLIAVMGYEEAGLLLIPPHPHAGSGHRAGLSRSDADGLVLSGGTPKTDVQPGSPPLRKERSHPVRPSCGDRTRPADATGRHGAPKPRLMKVRVLRGALGSAKTCGVIIRTTPSAVAGRAFRFSSSRGRRRPLSPGSPFGWCG